MSTPYAKVPLLTVHVGPAYEALAAPDIAVWFSLCSFARWVCNNRGEPVHSLPGSCFPTIKAVARRARCSIRAAEMSIRRLEALGHVVVEARHDEKGARKSNGYLLFSFPQLEEADAAAPIRNVPAAGATPSDPAAAVAGEIQEVDDFVV